MAVIDFNNTNGSTGTGGGSITIDSQMSDTSKNAVQNKVIKAYVDEKTSGSGGSGKLVWDIAYDRPLSWFIDLYNAVYNSSPNHYKFLVSNDALHSGELATKVTIVDEKAVFEFASRYFIVDSEGYYEDKERETVKKAWRIAYDRPKSWFAELYQAVYDSSPQHFQFLYKNEVLHSGEWCTRCQIVGEKALFEFASRYFLVDAEGNYENVAKKSRYQIVKSWDDVDTQNLSNGSKVHFLNESNVLILKGCWWKQPSQDSNLENYVIMYMYTDGDGNSHEGQTVYMGSDNSYHWGFEMDGKPHDMPIEDGKLNVIYRMKNEAGFRNEFAIFSNRDDIEVDFFVFTDAFIEKYDEMGMADGSYFDMEVDDAMTIVTAPLHTEPDGNQTAKEDYVYYEGKWIPYGSEYYLDDGHLNEVYFLLSQGIPVQLHIGHDGNHSFLADYRIEDDGIVLSFICGGWGDYRYQKGFKIDIQGNIVQNFNEVMPLALGQQKILSLYFPEEKPADEKPTVLEYDRSFIQDGGVSSAILTYDCVYFFGAHTNSFTFASYISEDDTDTNSKVVYFRFEGLPVLWNGKFNGEYRKGTLKYTNKRDTGEETWEWLSYENA